MIVGNRTVSQISVSSIQQVSISVLIYPKRKLQLSLIDFHGKLPLENLYVVTT